ncbi:TRAP transporter small permease [uncultured Psychromonas sp.]|uniref:TRAP transporter small permease n=1 Tax=uncultured Psychromonas sp. TaxID=173974 RepID=UPI003457CAB0
MRAAMPVFLSKRVAMLTCLLKNIEIYMCRLFFIAFISIILLQIISREIFEYSIIWSEELAVYLFVWFVFFGSSIAVTLNRHNRIDFQYKYFHVRLVFVLKVLSELTWLTFNIYFFYLCYDFVFNRMNLFWTSQTIGIPMKFVYVIMPLSFLLMTIRHAQMNFKAIFEASRS